MTHNQENPNRLSLCQDIPDEVLSHLPAGFKVLYKFVRETKDDGGMTEPPHEVSGMKISTASSDYDGADSIKV